MQFCKAREYEYLVPVRKGNSFESRLISGAQRYIGKYAKT